MSKAPPDIELMATCGTVSVSKGSTASGPTGKVSFEVIPESATQLAELLNKESFALTFAQDFLGDGYSISNLRFRPDADGNARAFVVFVVPETSTPAMALLIAHNRVGTKAKLVLTRNQLTISDQLTKKADDPTMACPFPGCSLTIDHPGEHEIDDDLLPA